MSEEKKNDENTIIIEPKQNIEKSQLSLLTFDEYNKKNSLTKFTRKSNKKWIYFQPKLKNINPEEKQILESTNIEKKEDNSKVLDKWKELQKSIKEAISLEELMIEKQMQDNSQLKEKFREYYNVKLKCRNEYETINNLYSSRQREKEYVISDNIERELLDTCEPIKNLMFLLRNRSEYIIKLKNLLIDDNEDVNSLVELFCNQFYDNILIPSKSQNNTELGILIYKLLEDEIISMMSATLDEFLNNNSFIGKFLSVYIRKDEFRLFFGKLLKPILLSIENKDDECLDISIINIKSKLNKIERQKEKEKGGSIGNINVKSSNKEEELDFNSLYKDIKKTTIEFKKNIDLDDESYKLQNNKEVNNNLNNNIIPNQDKKIINENLENNPQQNNDEFNFEYLDELTQDKIIQKILSEENKDIKDFYIHQLEQINSDPDIFTNNGLRNIINEYSKDGKNILNKYKQNFVFIKNLIDSLLQELINKMHVIPYSIKCICKIIYILISKKFPNLPRFYRNAFIGKFLFDKCIFPILSLDSKNAVLNRLFSSCVKGCVNVIINVLSTATRGSLYQNNSDTEKTIFNYYIIELIPILNEFYTQLMDIKLPTIIEQNLNKVDKQIIDNIDNKIFHFNRRKNPSKINQKENNINMINNNIKDNKKINVDYAYDYFKENPEEIMRLQGICFSVSDILTIINLISKNKNNKTQFENLAEYDFFNKTIERIKCDDYKLEELAKANPNNQKEKQVFYVIFKDERNNQLENLFKSKKKDKNTFISDEKSEKESPRLLNKIKFCIKNILKNIELNFSYLERATSTDKLFSAIFYHLNEIGEDSEIYEKVPIKWYAQYIYKNKNNLDLKYRENDYELLFKEMTEEEKEKLDELKNITSKIITKNNINLYCSNDLVNKINYSLDDVMEEEKIAKLEKFIETEEIKVCILVSKDKKEIQKLQIRDVEECDINSDFHKDPSKNRNKLSCHTHYIKDFINKFSYGIWDKENKLPAPKKLVSQEILSGQKKNKIYKAFNDYMNIIKKKLKEPININNKNLFSNINDFNDLLEKIEDFIFRQIYKNVFPTMKTNKDNEFSQKIQTLDWVTPEMLDIKNISINQLDYTIRCIQKINDGKSVNDKLNSIREAHASLNNVIKFSIGTDADAGQDEITPLFQYIIIRAKPESIYTNISFIKTFLDDSELSGSKGFLLTQIESAISYIEKIDKNTFKVKNNELDNKIE